jgi:imidazolonepropionase-like amidohydrolase
MADAAILVLKGRITWVGPKSQARIPPEAKVVDLTGTWVMPGLVDAHVHFFQSAGLYTRPDIIDLRAVRPYADEMAAIKADLADTFRRYLASGVTAVVDMGGPFWNFDIRDTARKDPLAPRVAVAGPLISTVARPQLDLGDPPIIRAQSPEHARKLVEEQLERKPDLTKIWFVLAPDRPPPVGAAIVAEVAEASHAAGVRLAVHATELETARLAVLNGADILVHSIQDGPIDSEFLALLKERNILYIPNLIVLEGYAEVLGRRVDLLPEERRWGSPQVVSTWAEMPPADSGEAAAQAAERTPLFARRMELARANLAPVVAAGIPLAAGTDAGNIGTLPGPSMHREMQLMVEAGMPVTDALKASTSGAARVFSPTPEFGTVAPGMLADLLVLEADPLADIRNVARIRFVVREGILHAPRDLVLPSPESVVQDQVDAYNARDVERFVALFSPDAEVLRHPSGEVLARGRDAIRATYSDLFEQSPDLHCRILRRTVQGRFVIDQELVTGHRRRPAVRAVAIYEIESGLIRRCWLVKE